MKLECLQIFSPVTITLESKEELQDFRNMAAYAMQNQFARKHDFKAVVLAEKLNTFAVSQGAK